MGRQGFWPITALHAIERHLLCVDGIAVDLGKRQDSSKCVSVPMWVVVGDPLDLVGTEIHPGGQFLVLSMMCKRHDFRPHS